jgi:hypothetical protein
MLLGNVHGGIRINAQQRQISPLPVRLKITNKNGSVNSTAARPQIKMKEATVTKQKGTLIRKIHFTG